MKVYFQIAECSLSSAKIVQTSAMKVYFQIAECSLSSAKIVQTSAMKVYFQIAECSLSSAKIINLIRLPNVLVQIMLYPSFCPNIVNTEYRG